jgi:hypothetical protein
MWIVLLMKQQITLVLQSLDVILASKKSLLKEKLLFNQINVNWIHFTSWIWIGNFCTYNFLIHGAKFLEGLKTQTLISLHLKKFSVFFELVIYLSFTLYALLFLFSSFHVLLVHGHLLFSYFILIFWGTSKVLVRIGNLK